MPESIYSCRRNRWSSETLYLQDSHSLRWKRARHEGSVPYGAIREVQAYKIRYFGSRATYWRCVLRYGIGRKITLQAAHHSHFRRVEDRTSTYIPFIKNLENRIATANPTVVFRQGRQWLTAVDAVFGALLVRIQRIARLLSCNRLAAAASWLMRKVGPRLKGHRIARANLVSVYPLKSASEIDRILLGMWDNIGRVFVEYAHLDRLWDYDPDSTESGCIVLDDASRKRFIALRDAEGPALVFGAHLANWELLAWALGCHKGEAAIVYRAPKPSSVQRVLAKMRSNSKVIYISADANAIFKIKNALRRGAWIGQLIDEHYSRGVDVEFFGRPCKATPIIGRLARQFDCPIYGARVVRLPAGQFLVDITDAISIPRDTAGKVDVAETTQLITTIVESWVREHPEQWLWLQRRWR
jgi:KDO2-lipid IV(A) lauroyltransferase